MIKAAQGSTVLLHYTGTLEDGTEFDSSRGGDPLQFTVGGGEVIPGFEEAVVGMAQGETKTFTIPADEAYGPRRDDLVMQVARDQFPPEIDFAVGQQYPVEVNEGQVVLVTVAALDDETVTLDANHPLAGKDLTFAVEVVTVA
ncbi:FKBP-type peptidyl-prolyl cis-trans isomerase [Methanofollis tationis]|uniref:Peptidyl-prolyl cis-trans isomerase n=1 Tax=Methanofollis tationis TaxID=81417 RepID=A0A7K4HRU0_9EURY|nr:peptidylprolyl isomerase [Methanofollis tationis]NVO67959.1 peptidylprolyl isomerase [Methanofollis tationis]